MGVPIFAVIYAAIKSVVNRLLRKKDLPTDIQPYMTVGQIDESKVFTEYIPPVKEKKKSTFMFSKLTKPKTDMETSDQINNEEK